MGGVVRETLMLLDKVIFGLIETAYNLIYSLSGIFINNDIAKKVITNLYIVVGIFALFKIALLLINSIIDPEKLNEKGKGLSSILVRTFIMIVLLLFTPMLFQMAYDLQARIVGWEIDEKGNYVTDDNGRAKVSNNGNIIEKLILGEKAATSSAAGNMKPGEQFESIALSALITVNENYGNEFQADGEYVGYKSTGKCSTQKCESAIIEWNKMYANGKMDINTLSKYIGVAEKIEICDENGENCEKEKTYVYDYTIILTTFVAGFIVYVLFSFALDIAARIFQLATLEIVSPLFIVTFIDSKSASSGSFNRWLKEVGSTYAGLFIRLACISLLLLFTSILNSLKWVENVNSSFRWTKLTLLLGLLLFAKKAPKLITEMLGMKSDGMGLGIGKKLASAALIGGGIGAARKAIGNGAKKLGKNHVDKRKKQIGNALDRGIARAGARKGAARAYRNGNRVIDPATNEPLSKRQMKAQAAKVASSRLKADQAASNDFRRFAATRDKFAAAATSIDPTYKSSREKKLGELNADVDAKLKGTGWDPTGMSKKIKDANDIKKAKAIYGNDVLGSDGKLDKLMHPLNVGQFNGAYQDYLGHIPRTSDEIRIAKYSKENGLSYEEARVLNEVGMVIDSKGVTHNKENIINSMLSNETAYQTALYEQVAYDNVISAGNSLSTDLKLKAEANRKKLDLITAKDQLYKPVEPVLPVAPVQPEEPQKNIVLPSGEIVKNDDYEQQMTVYEQQKDVYEQDIIKYNQELENYNSSMETYEIEKAEYDKNILSYNTAIADAERTEMMYQENIDRSMQSHYSAVVSKAITEGATISDYNPENGEYTLHANGKKVDDIDKSAVQHPDGFITKYGIYVEQPDGSYKFKKQDMERYYTFIDQQQAKDKEDKYDKPLENAKPAEIKEAEKKE